MYQLHITHFYLLYAQELSNFHCCHCCFVHDSKLMMMMTPFTVTITVSAHERHGHHNAMMSWHIHDGMLECQGVSMYITVGHTTSRGCIATSHCCWTSPSPVAGTGTAARAPSTAPGTLPECSMSSTSMPDSDAMLPGGVKGGGSMEPSIALLGALALAGSDKAPG